MQEKEGKMQRVEYQGKTYEKVKSLAPVEVLKEIRTECEQKNFIEYVYFSVYYKGTRPDDVNLEFVLGLCNKYPEWLPWLISHGFIREAEDERDEHSLAFHKFRVQSDKTIILNQYWERSKEIWDWFDQNPVPKKEK